MSQTGSARSQSPNPTQTLPDHLQAAVEQALGNRWTQLLRHIENQQNEANQRIQNQLDEALAAAASLAEARTRHQPERPALNAIKPTKPPTYEGARQGTFTQWAF